MNTILEEIITKGITRTVDGKPKNVNGQISKEEGKLIQKCIEDIEAEISVEVGLGFGTSALYICDHLKKTKKTKHYVIDPFQMFQESYAGIGLNNLKKAGYENIIEFIEKPSHLALADLNSKKVLIDFAFIDGWHTFDHALVDFFLVDKLLRTDGIVILDDADWPAVEKVCSFISKNRAYKFIGGSQQRSNLVRDVPEKNILKRLRIKKSLSGSGHYGAMAFRKVSKDSRRWDHFVDF